MAKVIRVTVTSVYEYTPDLNQEEYKVNGVHSTEDAMSFDQQDWKKGGILLEELTDKAHRVTALWEIVEDSS